MASRQFRVVIIAAIYGTINQVVTAGELAREIGIETIPRPVLWSLHVCFIFSVAIMIFFALPKLIRINIFVSNITLRAFDLIAKISDYGLEYCRRRALVGAEGLTLWLRAADTHADRIAADNGRTNR